MLNGRLYAAGGYELEDSTFELLSSVEAYDPESDVWSEVAALPRRLASFAIVACDGRLYVFGGEDGEEACGSTFYYDPAANAWDTLADMPTGRAGCVACVAPSGLIYVVGGNGEMGRCVEVYDRVANQWQKKGDLVRPRSNPGCVCLDGRLYVLGGYAVVGEEEEQHDSIEVYDEDADRWLLHECQLPQAKSRFGCVVMKLRPPAKVPAGKDSPVE
ncbi:kelch-like protein 3 [Paramacrobiotus metropolitanus]|uniref:kelch-like protein 3 n=1 Tax=Paramacrobiotus metropolitanus TaxID=2943436 RepID=UPI002445B177|nr:kelch-like protein 3 [Paramacrobiotus metropolitanus]